MGTGPIDQDRQPVTVPIQTDGTGCLHRRGHLRRQPAGMAGAALKQAISERFRDQRLGRVQPVDQPQQLHQHPRRFGLRLNLLHDRTERHRQFDQRIKPRRKRVSRVADPQQGKGRQVQRRIAERRTVEIDQPIGLRIPGPGKGQAIGVDQGGRAGHGWQGRTGPKRGKGGRSTDRQGVADNG